MKTTVKVLGGLVVMLAAYLCFWPIPAQPVSWTAPLFAGYVGPHAMNHKLVGLKLIDLGAESGPEHIAIGPDGKLYTTVETGRILRMQPDGSQQEVFAQTGGRVLGFDFDAKGHLIAADAVKGLLSIAPDKTIELLADRVDVGGKPDPIRYADAVAVAQNGKIYLSDASTRFAPKDWGGTFEASVLDILEQSATGRVLEFDPATGKIWLGFAKPRNAIIDQFADKPFMRALTLRLPRALWPIPKAYGHVMAFSEDGQVLQDLQDPSGQYPETTGVTETLERLYIHSLHAKGLGWLPR